MDESSSSLYDKKCSIAHGFKMKAFNCIIYCLKVNIVKIGKCLFCGHRVCYLIKFILQDRIEIILTDFLDALYSLKDNEIPSLAIKYLSVRFSNSPIASSNMYFKVKAIYYDGKDEWKFFNEVLQLMLGRRTNEIEQWRMFNFVGEEIDLFKRPYPIDSSLPKNAVSSFYVTASGTCVLRT